MDASNYLRKTHLEEHIRYTHQAITEQFPINNKAFDAWYTNRQYVSQRLLEIGREIAREIREGCGVQWRKDIPEELVAALEKVGASPKQWEDGPDGALAGVAVLAAGWIANQAAAKSRDNPSDHARNVFERCIRPLIVASMDLGIEIAERERKA